MAKTSDANAASYKRMADIPTIDIPANLRAALDAARHATGISADVLALRRRPGKLTPQEYFYYRLSDGQRMRADKRRFVGKIAQHPMHVAAGAREWFATSADKILFHSIMDGVALSTPKLIAITQAGRFLPDAQTIADAGALAAKLRDPALTRSSPSRWPENTASRFSAPTPSTAAPMTYCCSTEPGGRWRTSRRC